MGFRLILNKSLIIIVTSLFAGWLILKDCYVIPLLQDHYSTTSSDKQTHDVEETFFVFLFKACSLIVILADTLLQPFVKNKQ